MSQAGALNTNLLGNPVTVPHGGTGRTTLTDHAFLIGAGTSPVNFLGPGTNGQLPIGSTGLTPVLSTLTPGPGINIVNGAGSIMISNFAVITPTAISYIVLTTDYFIAVTDTSAPRTISLPNVGVTTGQIFIVKDASGGAFTNNITVNVNGGVKTIDGAASQPINANWNGFNFIYDGTNYLTF